MEKLADSFLNTLLQNKMAALAWAAVLFNENEDAACIVAIKCLKEGLSDEGKKIALSLLLKSQNIHKYSYDFHCLNPNEIISHITRQNEVKLHDIFIDLIDKKFDSVLQENIIPLASYLFSRQEALSSKEQSLLEKIFESLRENEDLLVKFIDSLSFLSCEHLLMCSEKNLRTLISLATPACFLRLRVSFDLQNGALPNGNNLLVEEIMKAFPVIVLSKLSSPARKNEAHILTNLLTTLILEKKSDLAINLAEGLFKSNASGGYGKQMLYVNKGVQELSLKNRKVHGSRNVAYQVFNPLQMALLMNDRKSIDALLGYGWKPGKLSQIQKLCSYPYTAFFFKDDLSILKANYEYAIFKIDSLKINQTQKRSRRLL